MSPVITGHCGCDVVAAWREQSHRLSLAPLSVTTGGRIGERLVDNDMLLLTTTGRHTGKPHTVPLLYLGDSDRLVVFASWGGRDRHPEWYLNLLAAPGAAVELPGRRLRVTAVTAVGDERARWWNRAGAPYDGYAEYQTRTDREIPVVFLEPTAEPRAHARDEVITEP